MSYNRLNDIVAIVNQDAAFNKCIAAHWQEKCAEPDAIVANAIGLLTWALSLAKCKSGAAAADALRAEVLRQIAEAQPVELQEAA